VEQFEGSLVDPVGNDDRLQFFVIVVIAWTVDCHGAQSAVGVLGAIVAVIPRGTILSHPELVLHRVALGSRALSDTCQLLESNEEYCEPKRTIDAVHVILVQVTKAVPVDSAVLVRY